MRTKANFAPSVPSYSIVHRLFAILLLSLAALSAFPADAPVNMTIR
ncbi:MAG: hypothetical protein QOE82_74, partial [Thermoanaerobaculia bacterium]|nr:hypothetical protein [Thermoanaerobaculia bacterium]